MALIANNSCLRAYQYVSCEQRSDIFLSCVVDFIQKERRRANDERTTERIVKLWLSPHVPRIYSQRSHTRTRAYTRTYLPIRNGIQHRIGR